MPAPPGFDEWVAYCFTQGHTDFWRKNTDGNDALEGREERFLNMDAVLLATYLTRLFESPAFLADRCTDHQLAEGIWFLFGCGSGFIGSVRSGLVPPDLQARCIRSIATMYTDLFDRVCGLRGGDPDSDLRDTSDLDGAVYMIWDMDQLEGAVMFPEKGPHLVEPSLQVLQTVLDRCRTSACRVSALHGIGHIYSIHNYSGDKAIARRLQRMIDTFLDTRDPPEWLRDYAAYARDGCVQ